MLFLSEFTEYKRRLANLIVRDEMCVELLTGEKGHKLPAADLIGKYVYLYDYVDETIKDAKAIICIEIDEQYATSPTARNFDLHIYVSVHKNFMNFIDENGRGQVRRDLLCSRIDALINNSSDFGFQKLEPREGFRIVFSSDHRTKDMVYRIKGWNVYGDALVR